VSNFVESRKWGGLPVELIIANSDATSQLTSLKTDSKEEVQ